MSPVAAEAASDVVEAGDRVAAGVELPGLDPPHPATATLATASSSASSERRLRIMSGILPGDL